MEDYHFCKIPQDSLWLAVSPKQTDSKFWKCFLKQKEFIASSLCIQINNGYNTKVWAYPWIPSLSPPIPSPLSPLLPQDSPLRLFELTLEEPGRWNLLLLQALFSQETVNEIEKIHLAQYQFHNTRDTFKWTHHSNWTFLVSAYATISIQSNVANSPYLASLWKKLWSFKIQDCPKLFL